MVSYLPFLGLRFDRRSWRRIDQRWADCLDPLILDPSLNVLLGGLDTISNANVYLPHSFMPKNDEFPYLRNNLFQSDICLIL